MQIWAIDIDSCTEEFSTTALKIPLPSIMGKNVFYYIPFMNTIGSRINDTCIIRTSAQDSSGRENLGGGTILNNQN